jgi:hypothetical protein
MLLYKKLLLMTFGTTLVMQQHDELKAYEGDVDEFLACTPEGISG